MSQGELRTFSEVQALERKLFRWGLTLLMGIVGSAATMGVWVGTINNRVDHNEQTIAENAVKLELVKGTQSDIRVQLARIEAILLEIRDQSYEYNN
jgi:hypothetical protein